VVPGERRRAGPRGGGDEHGAQWGDRPVRCVGWRRRLAPAGFPAAGRVLRHGTALLGKGRGVLPLATAYRRGPEPSAGVAPDGGHREGAAAVEAASRLFGAGAGWLALVVSDLVGAQLGPVHGGEQLAELRFEAGHRPFARPPGRCRFGWWRVPRAWRGAGRPGGVRSARSGRSGITSPHRAEVAARPGSAQGAGLALTASRHNPVPGRGQRQGGFVTVGAVRPPGEVAAEVVGRSPDGAAGAGRSAGGLLGRSVRRPAG
jgi:hypothetical protein